MMITLPEVTAAVYGVGRLLRLDTSGYSFLDTSRRGFFMSFWAAVFILPGIFVLGRFDPATEQLGVHPFRFLSVTAIHYVLSWVAYPLVMWHITERLDRLNRYVLYIVAYNWASVLDVSIPVAVALVGFEIVLAVALFQIKAMLIY